MTPPARAVAQYASRLYGTLDPSAHHVASAFGAWLLLALVDDPALSEVLGTPAGDANAAARSLLASPHPVLSLAAAAWGRDEVVTPELERWLDSLPPGTDSGPIPSQADADAWAREHTHGLIEQFPLGLGASVALVLATAVACAISWQTHFDPVDSAELVLPPVDGFASVRTLLRTPATAAQHAIVDSPAGLVAVHEMPSTDLDLSVVSVIAGPSVPAATVLDLAHDLAIAPRQSVSLFDLPLGDGHSWRLSEQVVVGPHDEERFDSVLPAWSASSEHDLADAPGFADAAAALIRMLPSGDWVFDAKQSAMARYTRTGFEAAAVTALGVRAAGMFRQSRQVRVRTARVEYTHPYAVVAVTRGAGSPWDAVPVFSAWVTHADEG